MDVTSPRTAAGRLGLPPGATVADLVAALSGQQRPMRSAPPAHSANRPAAASSGLVDVSRLDVGRTGVDRPGPPSRPRHSLPPHAAAPAAPPIQRASRPPAPSPRPVTSTPPQGTPLRARPPIGDDLSLFGLSRRSRSRLGSRVFALFFTMVFGLILVQMIFSILYP